MEHPGARINQERCTGCGLCAQACGRKLIALEEGKARVAAPGRCVLCGHCRAVCPVEAPFLPEVDPADFLPIPPPAQHPTPKQTMLLMRSRRSIRFFREQAVEEHKLALLLEAARYAPTGQNRQALGCARPAPWMR